MQEQKDWLERITPPKYLRYLFYIIHSFYRSYKSERQEAPVSAILFLGFIHLFLFLGLFIFLYSWYINGLVLDDIETKHKLDSFLKLTISSGFFVNCLFFYFGFYYKNKWKHFINEFSYLKQIDRKKGAVYLFIYLLILVLFFVLSFWSITKTSPYYK